MVFGKHLPRMVADMQIQAIGNGQFKASAAQPAAQPTSTSKAAAATAVPQPNNFDAQQLFSMMATMLKDMGKDDPSSLGQTGANLNIIA